MNSRNLMLLSWIRPEQVQRHKPQRLIRTDIKRVAYVSCNPVTFARDVAQMVAGGFTLDWVQPVDQFRWSSMWSLRHNCRA